MSDLAAHPELRVALSHEFAGRRDGWLDEDYRLPSLDDAPGLDED